MLVVHFEESLLKPTDILDDGRRGMRNVDELSLEDIYDRVQCPLLIQLLIFQMTRYPLWYLLKARERE